MSDLPIEAAPDQTYGVGQDQLAQQAAIPLPNNRAPSPAAAPPEAPAPGQTPPADPLARAVESAGAMPFHPVGLAGPSAFPDEPLTAGLGIGHGPGPEALPPMPHARNYTADVLATLAEVRQSPQLAALADRLRSDR